MDNTLKLGSYTYQIISQEVIKKEESEGILYSISVTAYCPNSICELEEVSFSCIFKIKNYNTVTEPLDSTIFAVEFMKANSSSIEVYDDGSIHWHGTVDINWNDEFGKDVEFDLSLNNV